MTAYLTSIWRYRFFWLALMQLDLRTRYRGTLLGIGWSLLRPISLTAVLCLVFHKIFHLDAWHYAPFLMAGLSCWQFLCSATFDGCQCFFRAESYIRQHRTPLAIYPLRATLNVMVHFLIALAVVIAMSCWVHGPGDLASFASLIPAALLTFAFGWSLATIAGLSHVFFRDTQHLCEVAFQLLFYATPVVYRPQMLYQNQLRWLAQCNPLVAFLELFRQPVLEGRVPSTSVFLTATCTAVCFVTLASLLLARLERGVVFRL